jgi:hypothetical protein
MTHDSRLEEARKYARSELVGGAYEYVFQRSRRSKERLKSQEIFHDQHQLRRHINPHFPRRRRLSEAKLIQLYDAATLNHDTDAQCRLLTEVIDYLGLKLRSLVVDALIRSYAVQALENYMMLVSKKRGRKAEKNFARDWFIGRTVEELRRFGFSPTRNRAERQRQSGCSIVAEVLADGGLHLSEQAVEKIWRHHHGQR